MHAAGHVHRHRLVSVVFLWHRLSEEEEARDRARAPPQDRNYWSDAALRTWATMYVGNNQKLRRDYNQTSAQGMVAKSKKSPYTAASRYTAASETGYAPSMDDIIKSVLLKSKQRAAVTRGFAKF